MIWIVIAALAALGVSILYHIAQRRQIDDICRQLAFLEEKDSSLEITLRLHSAPFRRLQDHLNRYLRHQRQMTAKVLVKETRFKESIADLSHDIRTPLTSLDGYFQLLLETEDPEKRRKYCDMISGRIAALRELLEELFAYARLQDENDTLPCAVMPVNAIVTHTLLSFYQECRSRGIEPEVEMPDEAVNAHCSETALRRVIQNVLKNALMHGSPSQPLLRVTLQEEGDAVRIRIRNRCTDPEHLDVDRIFERFYRSDRARSGAGTGLGLSIARGLTEKMGGSISGELEDDLFTVIITLRRS